MSIVFFFIKDGFLAISQNWSHTLSTLYLVFAFSEIPNLKKKNHKREKYEVWLNTGPEDENTLINYILAEILYV